jgi:hypothetical protein
VFGVGLVIVMVDLEEFVGGGDAADEGERGSTLVEVF